MGKLTKLFQAKRILAIVLAIAMTVTSLPVTAHAAEPDDLQPVTETAAEDASAQDNAETETEDEQTDSAQDPKTGAVQQPKADETQDPETDDVQQPETDAVQQPKADETQDLETDDVQQPKVGEPQDPVQQPAELGESEFTWEGDSNYATYAVQWDAAANAYVPVSPVADETGKKLSGSFLRDYYVTVNKGTEQEQQIGLNGTADPVAATITYQWFAGDSPLGDPKKLTEEGTLPTDAGTYRLHLVLPAKENAYSEAGADYTYEIRKSEVSVSIADPAVVPVGTKWSEVPVPQIYSVVADSGQTFTYVPDDPATPANEAEKNEVAFTLVVRDAATDEALKGDMALVKNGEYVLSVTPEFIGTNKDRYDSNYTFAHCADQKLTVGDLKETRLTLTPDASYNAKPAVATADDRALYVIEAESFTANLQNFKYTAKLEEKDGVDEAGKQKWKEVAVSAAEITGAWYTTASYGGTWTEKDTTYCNLRLGSKMETAPANAGAYVYRVSYAGNQEEYGASYADIVVVVDAAEIIVKPVAPSGVVFYDGQPVLDVLSQIDYALVNAKDNSAYPISENMWGTSYEPIGKTQPYKPDYTLVEISKDQSGKETGRREYTTANVNTGRAVLDIKKEYQVRFSGYKNVYRADGSVYGRVDINARVDSMDPDTCGFKVMTDPETLEANFCTLEVQPKNKAVNVADIKAAAVQAGMTQEAAGALDEAYTKIYDGKAVFDLYADYKKAKLTSGESDPVKDFTYSWSRSQYTAESLLETVKADPADPNSADVPAVSKEDLENGNWYSVLSVSPYNAGVYRLRVAYKNSRKQGYADPVDIYFVIRKQKVTFGFNKETLNGNVGNSIYTFTENNRQELAGATTLTPELTSPTTAANWKNRDRDDVDEDVEPYTYGVTWGFYQKRMKVDGDGNEVPDTNADGTFKWDQVYTLTGTGEYFLGVSSYSMSNMSNFAVVMGDVKIPITVKAMGTKTIAFDGITTADGEEIAAGKTYDADSIYGLLKDDLARLNSPIVVTTDGDGKEIKGDKVNLADAPYGLVYAVYDSENDWSWTYERELPTEESDWAWAKNAGTYTISVSFSGNDEYAPLYDTELATVTVDQRKLTLKVPELADEFKAGQTAGEVLAAARRPFHEQPETAEPILAESDKGVISDSLRKDMKQYFSPVEKNGETGSLAWYDSEDDSFSLPSSLGVHDSKNDEYCDYDTVLQGNGSERYRLKGGAYGAFEEDECTQNYVITAVEPVEGTPVKVVRGAAEVAVSEYGSNSKKVDIADEVGTPETAVGSIVREHNVKLLDGIGYSNSTTPEGNLVKVEITAPAEYEGNVTWSKVYCDQAIKNAAGDRLVGSISKNGNKLSFVYNATEWGENKEDKPGDLDFSIRWEEGYSERFVLCFSKAVLLGNLQEAVAPKSLAFNAPLTTMVVGQEQQLDVKITKVQNADIICLGYEVTDGEPGKMHVDEYGKVTALGVGKATVEVFPMHLVDGRKVKIPGAKSARTTITVKAVSAPKVTKVVSSGTGLNVQYTLPNEDDGCRREIYVVEGKNVKAADIKDMINEEMVNEQWQGIFAVAPKFYSHFDEYQYGRIYDSKKQAYTNTVSFYIDGLNPNTDYTVYVRNVSAMRSFADGCKVTLSEAGTPKSGKTAMRFVEDITAELENEHIEWTGDDPDVYYGSDEAPTREEIRDADVLGYEVPLSKKSVKIAMEGLFTDAAGDVATGGYVPLPLAGANLAALKKDYAAPKMAYYFYDYIYEGYDAYDGSRVFEDYGYTKASSIAAISNKGVVTLKQPGTVTIVAIDTVSGERSNKICINITADADSMKAKNAAMQVGQSIRLENLVEYKQGRTVLNQSCYNTYGRIDVKAAQDSLKAVDSGNEYFGISDDGYLTAYGKTTKPLQIELTDKKLKTSVTVKISAKELAVVKGLKAVNVIDNRFDVQFEMNPYAEGYRIEIKDASKKTIRSIYVENIPHSDGEWNDWGEGGYWTQWSDDDWGNVGSGNWQGYSDPYHRSEHWVSTGKSLCRADMEKGKWILTYRIDRLTQVSKYGIEVKALYGEAESKLAKKSVSTTKLPACDDVVAGKGTGGLDLSRYSFVSGNTYSIQVTGSGLNSMARIAGTDTLTWTSSDKKVVSVSATSGGYSASLKALKPGTSVIEIKSKVLKGVIARRTVTVSAVGDAYLSSAYYGDNEALRGGSTTMPGSVIELTVGAAKAVSVKGSQKFRVTLTEPGIYRVYLVSQEQPTVETNYISMTKSTTTEDKWEFSISSTFTGSVIVKKTGESGVIDPVKNRTKILLNGTMPANRLNAWYVFTAPEDGLYGFKSGSYVQDSAVGVYRQGADGEANTSDAASYNYFFEMKQGEMVYLKAQTNAQLRLVKAQFETLALDSSVTVSGGSEKWFKFTPAEMDVYELKTSVYNGASFFDTDFALIRSQDGSEGPEGNGYFYNYDYMLSSAVYLRIKNNYSNDGTVRIIKKNSFQKFGGDGTYTVTERTFNSRNDYLYITYKIPASGFYSFSFEATERGVSGSALLKQGSSEQELEDMYISTGGTDKTENKFFEKDAEVYLQIQADSYPVTWRNVKFTAAKTGDAPAELQAGAEASGEAVSGGVVWYQIKAQETGRYTVIFPKMDAGAGSIRVRRCASLNDESNHEEERYVNLSTGGLTATFTLEAEESKWIRVTTSEATKQPYKIRLEKASTNRTVKLDAPVDLTEVENWIAFTAAEEGVYQFSRTTNADNTQSIIWIYKNAYDTEDYNIIYGSSPNIAMGKDDTVWLRVTSNSLLEDPAQADKLTVTKLDAVVKTAEVSLAAPVTLKDLTFTQNPNDSTSYDAIIQITAAEEGRYQFTCNDESNYVENVFLCKSPALSIYERNGKDFTYAMQAGDIVWLCVQANTSEVSGVTLTVTGKELAISLPGRVEVDSGYQWCKYTAPTAGTYLFYSGNNDGDPRAWFFKDMSVGNDMTERSILDNIANRDGFGYDDDNDNNLEPNGGTVSGNNFAREVPLGAGETVYVAVGNYSLDESLTCDVYVERR